MNNRHGVESMLILKVSLPVPGPLGVLNHVYIRIEVDCVFVLLDERGVLVNVGFEFGTVVDGVVHLTISRILLALANHVDPSMCT